MVEGIGTDTQKTRNLARLAITSRLNSVRPKQEVEIQNQFSSYFDTGNKEQGDKVSTENTNRPKSPHVSNSNQITTFAGPHQNKYRHQHSKSVGTQKVDNNPNNMNSKPANLESSKQIETLNPIYKENTWKRALPNSESIKIKEAYTVEDITGRTLGDPNQKANVVISQIEKVSDPILPIPDHMRAQDPSSLFSA